jgi:hypothetical protein
MSHTERRGDPLHQTGMCLKRYLMDVLIAHSDLPEARREVKMSAKMRVHKLIKGVIYTRKWIGVLTRNLVKFTVINAESQRAISFTHQKD